jgi:hypothetical protein
MWRTRIKGGGTRCMRRRLSSYTPVDRAHSPPLSFSPPPSPSLTHRISVTCSPYLIKGRVGSSREGLSAFLLLLLPSPSRRNTLFSSFISSHLWLKKLQRLGAKLSLAYLYPLLQISVNNITTKTGRRTLLSRGPNQYKSSCTPIAQPSEVRHAIRYKFPAGDRELQQREKKGKNEGEQGEVREREEE